MNWLAFIWIGIIAFGIIMYVLLDGFDLGTGIMLILIEDNHDRDIMISTILPTWDGNQTWLVFGGAALYGAFPIAFSTILPIIYLPILLMVIALLFRGVAFEYRLKTTKGKRFWDGCFFFGSILASFIQGAILGNFIRGFNLNTSYQQYYQWLNPFSIVCGIALIFGYLLLGSNRLIAKTTGQLQQTFYRISEITQFIILSFTIVISIWSPFLDPVLKERWFDPQNMRYLAILPAITVLLFILHWYSLRKKHEYTPFWAAVGVFLMCYIGFIISSYPYVVPRHFTFNQAAANDSTLLFMLVGACIMLPILLYYTYYSYHIFKGKVTEKIEY